MFECACLTTFLQDEGELPEENGNNFSKIYEELSRMLFTMIKNLEK